MATSDVVLTEDLANQAWDLAHEFNREIEATQDIRSGQLRAAARKLDELAARAERGA